MKIVLSLGLTLVFSALALSEPACHSSELMACIDIIVDWVHTYPKRSVPTTEDEMKYGCGELKKALDCGFKYRDNCMTPLQKELLGLVSEGAQEYVAGGGFCRPDSPIRQRYLANAPCLSKAAQTDEFKEEIEYLLAYVENIKKQSEKDLIMYACCGYKKIYRKVLTIASDNCGKESMDPVLDMLRMLAAQLPDVLCNGIQGNEDRCVAILPAEGAKASSEAQKSKIYTFLRNFFKNWLD